MRASGQRGFSLIELVVALGLLAGVLISISGMFVFGGRQVKSGRTSSEALSVARDILEEINGWGFHETYARFGYDGSQPSYTVDTRTNSFAKSNWQGILDQKLLNAYAIIEIRSLSYSGSPPNLNATRAIRVLVTVNWREGGRSRSVQLGTVRI
jgi:prepilin-type N-terminal cleavage/methylation domain-containing protein